MVLSPPALAVIKGRERAARRPWAMVTREAGLDGLRIHDLRHSFASFGAGGGLGLPIVGKLLNHANAVTTARYEHLDADPLRVASADRQDDRGGHGEKGSRKPGAVVKLRV